MSFDVEWLVSEDENGPVHSLTDNNPSSGGANTELGPGSRTLLESLSLNNLVAVAALGFFALASQENVNSWLGLGSETWLPFSQSVRFGVGLLGVDALLNSTLNSRKGRSALGLAEDLAALALNIGIFSNNIHLDRMSPEMFGVFMGLYFLSAKNRFFDMLRFDKSKVSGLKAILRK